MILFFLFHRVTLAVRAVIYIFAPWAKTLFSTSTIFIRVYIYIRGWCGGISSNHLSLSLFPSLDKESIYIAGVHGFIHCNLSQEPARRRPNRKPKVLCSDNHEQWVVEIFSLLFFFILYCSTLVFCTYYYMNRQKKIVLYFILFFCVLFFIIYTFIVSTGWTWQIIHTAKRMCVCVCRISWDNRENYFTVSAIRVAPMRHVSGRFVCAATSCVWRNW